MRGETKSTVHLAYGRASFSPIYRTIWVIASSEVCLFLKRACSVNVSVNHWRLSAQFAEVTAARVVAIPLHHSSVFETVPHPSIKMSFLSVSTKEKTPATKVAEANQVKFWIFDKLTADNPTRVQNDTAYVCVAADDGSSQEARSTG